MYIVEKLCRPNTAYQLSKKQKKYVPIYQHNLETF